MPEYQSSIPSNWGENRMYTEQDAKKESAVSQKVHFSLRGWSETGRMWGSPATLYFGSTAARVLLCSGRLEYNFTRVTHSLHLCDYWAFISSDRPVTGVSYPTFGGGGERWFQTICKVREPYLRSHHFLKMLSKRAFWVFLRVKESLRESILNTKVHTKANYIHNFKKVAKYPAVLFAFGGWRARSSCQGLWQSCVWVGGRACSWRWTPKSSWVAHCGPRKDDAGDRAFVPGFASCQALFFVLAPAVKDDWGHRPVTAHHFRAWCVQYSQGPSKLGDTWGSLLKSGEISIA